MSAENQNGFSLVELVVVVAVLGIIAVPTTIYFVNFSQSQALSGAAQQVVNALNQARQLAITNNASYKVDFNGSPATGTMTTAATKFRYGNPSSCTTACTWWTGPGTESSGYRTLENNAQITCASATPTFNALGTATPTTLTVKTATGDASRYVVISATGRVRQASSATVPPPACP